MSFEEEPRAKFDEKGLAPMAKSIKVEEGIMGNVLSTPALHDASACETEE
jgi:hypothetical protein